MELARYVVEAVVLEGRSYREVARAHGVSKSWVGKLVGRYRAGGYEAIAPRSRAARRIPHRTPDELEDEIVALRKELTELGLDAGAATIHYHLSRRHQASPSVSTIWRVLRRRGFVTPQPHKRPETLLGADERPLVGTDQRDDAPIRCRPQLGGSAASLRPRGRVRDVKISAPTAREDSMSLRARARKLAEDCVPPPRGRRAKKPQASVVIGVPRPATSRWGSRPAHQ